MTRRMHVLKGDTLFNERRNSSRVWPVPHDAHKDALRAVASWRARDPEGYRWITDGCPLLTEAEHVARFGEPYKQRARPA